MRFLRIAVTLGSLALLAACNRASSPSSPSMPSATAPPDYYPVMYTAHNYQFLAYSAAMEGRKAETIDAVSRSRAAVSDSMLLEMPGTDWYVAEYYTARVRFGLWDELLTTPPPDRRLPGLFGGYLFARAMAQAATGRISDARASLASVNALVTNLPTGTPAGQNQLRDVLGIASAMIEARIASAERRARDEIEWLRKAVAAEDRIAYDEPKNWFVPTRHALGAALLRSGAAREAEAVYREDLVQNPANGWALNGLRAALEAQGKRGEAASVADEFKRAWRNADVSLSSSEL